jgi:ribosomal protein S18 acetylase RimI-like enzyme
LKPTKTKSLRQDSGRRLAGARPRSGSSPGEAVAVRPVRRGDLAQIIAIDATVTGLEKRDYWLSIYRRYGDSGQAERKFLVADDGERVVGFVIGEVRDWEFGSPPCGWVFAIDVKPDSRQAGVGTRLLDAICASFQRAGVRKVRTMLGRDNTLILSFFRSQGMMAGPFIPLEMDLAT